MTEQIVGGLIVKKASYHTHLNVKHLHGDLISAIVIEGDTPLAAMHAGERVVIGGLEGFPESRHTAGRVQRVAHTLGGGALDFTHVTLVDIDEVVE